jgi:hypothetical protein
MYTLYAGGTKWIGTERRQRACARRTGLITQFEARINDQAHAIDENCSLAARGAGPIGWPGSAEVVNMQPPDYLLRQGIRSLPTLGPLSSGACIEGAVRYRRVANIAPRHNH